MGDTPNIAARLQGLAAPNTVVLSAVTARLLHGVFLLEDLGVHQLKGVAEHMPVFCVLGAGEPAGDEVEPSLARTHLEQGIALTDLMAQRAQALRHGEAPGVRCLAMAALTLWCLGYPAQAVRRGQEALALSQELTHPSSLANAQHFATYLHYRRREVQVVQAQAEALLTLATAQKFPLYVGHGNCWRGWALAMQGQGAAGLAQLRQGMAAILATGQMLSRPRCLVLCWHRVPTAGDSLGDPAQRCCRRVNTDIYQVYLIPRILGTAHQGEFSVA